MIYKRCKALIPNLRPNFCIVSPLKFIDTAIYQNSPKVYKSMFGDDINYCVQHIIHDGSDEMKKANGRIYP